MGSPAPTTRAARPAPCAAAAAQPGCGPAERARPSDCPASPHGHRSVAYKCELPVASTVPLKASRSKMRDNFRAEGKVARVCMRGSNDLATGVGHSARTLDSLDRNGSAHKHTQCTVYAGRTTPDTIRRQKKTRLLPKDTASIRDNACGRNSAMPLLHRKRQPPPSASGSARGARGCGGQRPTSRRADGSPRWPRPATRPSAAPPAAVYPLPQVACRRIDTRPGGGGGCRGLDIRLD